MSPSATYVIFNHLQGCLSDAIFFLLLSRYNLIQCQSELLFHSFFILSSLIFTFFFLTPQQPRQCIGYITSFEPFFFFTLSQITEFRNVRGLGLSFWGFFCYRLKMSSVILEVLGLILLCLWLSLDFSSIYLFYFVCTETNTPLCIHLEETELQSLGFSTKWAL